MLTKGFKDWFLQENADIVCLQEIKAQTEDLCKIDYLFSDYHFYINSAERKGYSGVAVYSKKEPEQVLFGLSDPRFDNEGRVIRMKFKQYWLMNIYFPNGQRSQDRVEYKLDFYATLLNLCNEIHNKGEKIIITGDFNTAHKPIDLANPKENETTSGFLPEERLWITRYLQNGFSDIYREKYPEKIEYTWWTYRFNARSRNIGWRIDYYLISESLLDSVQNVIHESSVLGSDHCPVKLIIKS